MRAAFALLVLAAALAPPSAQERFRSDVHLVTMDVTVRAGGSPVRGLRSTDFVVVDSGVPREVTAVYADTLPIDVTLLLDTSGSMVGTLDAMRSNIRDVASKLTPDDRLRVMTVADDVRELVPFQPARAPLTLDTLTAGGWTPLYDGLGLALLRRRVPDRGHLIVIFSDGDDSASTLSLDAVDDLARRSSAVVHVFGIGPARPPGRNPRLPDAPPIPPVGRVADATGGRAVSMRAGEDIPSGFRAALEDFRFRYVVSWAGDATPVPGWHPVTVRVTRPGKFDVRTRPGYVQ